MQIDARGNYLPEPLIFRPLREPQPATRVDTTCWQLFRPAINTAHFYFFVAEVMSNYLTTDGLKIFSLLPEAPLRPVAFATSATSGTDWMCAKSLNTEGSFAVKQISVEPRLRMGWQHDAAQICC